MVEFTMENIQVFGEQYSLERAILSRAKIRSPQTVEVRKNAVAVVEH